MLRLDPVGHVLIPSYRTKAEKERKLDPDEIGYLQALRDGRDPRVQTERGLREPKEANAMRMAGFVTSVRDRDHTGALVGWHWELSEAGRAALAAVDPS